MTKVERQSLGVLGWGMGVSVATLYRYAGKRGRPALVAEPASAHG